MEGNPFVLSLSKDERSKPNWSVRQKVALRQAQGQRNKLEGKTEWKS